MQTASSRTSQARRPATPHRARQRLTPWRHWSGTWNCVWLAPVCSGLRHSRGGTPGTGRPGSGRGDPQGPSAAPGRRERLRTGRLPGARGHSASSRRGQRHLGVRGRTLRRALRRALCLAPRRSIEPTRLVRTSRLPNNPGSNQASTGCTPIQTIMAAPMFTGRSPGSNAASPGPLSGSAEARPRCRPRARRQGSPDRSAAT